MGLNLINARPNIEELPRYLWDGQCFTHSQDVSAASAGTDNPLLLLRNNSGDGKYIYLYHISGGCAVANVSFTFKLFANPTVTNNGTTQTPRSLMVGGNAASSMSMSSFPAVSSNGNVLMSSVSGQNSNSFVSMDKMGCLIAPGGAVLMTGNPLSNNRLASVNIRWVEM